MAVVENSVTNNHVESNEFNQSESSVIDSRSNDRNQKMNDEIRDLQDMLSKLNPMAEEFVPPSLYSNGYNGVVLQSPLSPVAAQFGYGGVNEFMIQANRAGFGNMNGGGFNGRVCFY